MKKMLSGIIYVTLLSALTLVLDRSFNLGLELITLGLLIGMVVSNTLGTKESQLAGINFSMKHFLKIGIILMGFNIDFALILELGPKVLGLIMLLITFGISFAYFIGKKWSLNPRLATLIGVGSTICGTAAIIAMGPVIDADDEDISLSVAVISVLGLFGVLVFSRLSSLVPLSDIAYGIWSGTSLQGVSHAIAAASARGADSVSIEVGTIVKMTRVSLIVPVSLILGSKFSINSSNKKAKFPYYVLFFILAGLINTLNLQFAFIPNVTLSSQTYNPLELLGQLNTYFLLFSLVAMGLKTNLRTLGNNALTALRLGSLVFVLVAGLSYLLVR